MRLGILGGTFDPIHQVHLFIGEEARVRLKLDRVVFVPNSVPPHKRPRCIASAEERYEMTVLATRSNPHFGCSRVELDRPGPSYTVDTLRALQTEHPSAELFFIIGLDAAAEISTWRQPEEVIRLARLVTIPRPGYTAEELRAAIPPAYRTRMEMLETPELGISSTMIRERVGAGLPIRYLTPDAVVEYIAERGLYGCYRNAAASR